MTFSVIIPTFNRPAKIEQCLQSLATLNYPCNEFEVIVIDDGSTTPLSQSIDTRAYSFPLTIARQSNSGPGIARNLGASLAKGQYLAFTDDDCLVNPNWLTAFESTLHNHHLALLGGEVINGCPQNLCAETNSLLLKALGQWFESNASSLHFFTSNNLACSREAFETMGGFNPGIRLAASEDREFCMRWSRNGQPLLSCPEALIHHFHPQNLLTFTRMHFRYGRGAARLHSILNSSPTDNTHLGLYLKILAAPFRTRPAFKALAIFPLLVLSQLIGPLGYAVEWRNIRQSSSKLRSGSIR